MLNLEMAQTLVDGLCFEKEAVRLVLTVQLETLEWAYSIASRALGYTGALPYSRPLEIHLGPIWDKIADTRADIVKLESAR
jgi:hypothetical protein